MEPTVRVGMNSFVGHVVDDEWLETATEAEIKQTFYAQAGFINGVIFTVWRVLPLLRRSLDPTSGISIDHVGTRLSELEKEAKEMIAAIRAAHAISKARGKR